MAKDTVDTGGVTAEDVWTILSEIAASQKETEKVIQGTKRSTKEIDKKAGELSKRFGAEIREKFNALGFVFEEVSQSKIITDAAGKHITEIDMLLESDKTVMVAAVKARPSQNDVKEHIDRIEILRRRADVSKDTRELQGAIAGAVMSNEIRSHILQNGFYIIEQIGDTAAISMPEGFTPRRW